MSKIKKGIYIVSNSQKIVIFGWNTFFYQWNLLTNKNWKFKLCSFLLESVL